MEEIIDEMDVEAGSEDVASVDDNDLNTNKKSKNKNMNFNSSE